MIVFDNSTSPTNMSPKYARTTIRFGGPLDVDGVRYASMNETDDPDEMQEAIIKDFTYMVRDLIHDTWDIDSTNNGLKIDQFTMKTFFEDLLQVLIGDSLFAVFAMFFVWAVITVHLRSCCLSCLGISLISLSFPVAIFLTSAIF